jgi:hypothetical protein
MRERRDASLHVTRADRPHPKGRELIEQGKYLEASEILNRLVFAEPEN